MSAKILRSYSVRLVAMDRPGYGMSTANPAGGFTDWAHDAAALTGHLGLDRFAVIGVSMGAGPALALAATRPDLVTSTTILSGMPPITPAERWAPDSRGDALYWRLARRAPWLLRRLCSVTTTMTGTFARGDAGRLIRRVERGLPDADARALRELVRDADARAAFVADLLESSRQGGAAMAEDLRLYLRPWGFGPADVPGLVCLWRGTDDPKVPVALARRLAAQLSQASARFVPGGHFAAFAHQEEIIGEIAAERH
ncbi:alpha/beta fold hydrolase [Streptosporangium sandarakinum]|uniref:alpha/beta fold hydrolase n=1 Tax=Streptosporangium sandarakinum TaxID=1260955 RepID=UPI0036BF1B9D